MAIGDFSVSFSNADGVLKRNKRNSQRYTKQDS